MKKIAIIISQLLVLVFIRIVYIGRIKVQISDEDSKITGPIVIAANHTNDMDPFIIACFLPLKMIFRVFPYCFMTANIYYYRLWKPLAFLAGCYPAKPRDEFAHPDSYGVDYSVKALAEGYSVVMFPEGRRTRKQIQAKPGISRILQIHKTQLLLCRMDWKSSSILSKVTLTIKTSDKNLEVNDPDAIMNAVYSLSPQEVNITAVQKA
jgi:1-acyl-sn-glycerol-3-phosphate acyltransferase